jgi:TonB family protein
MIMRRVRISRIASLALAASLIAVAAPAQAAPASIAERISAAVARVMDYPREAVPRDEEGVVVIGFTVGHSGAAEAIELVATSGHPLLDQAAVGAVTRLHDLPADATGRRSLAILQYRVGGAGRDPEAARILRKAVDQLQSRRPNALLSAGYSR